MIFCPPRRSKGKIKGLTLRMDYGPLTASEMLYETPEIRVNSSIRFTSIQVVTSGYFGRKSTQVVQESNYGTNRVWTNNPTFLLSGQLTGK